MLILVFLKSLSDAAFYMTLAGSVAVGAGVPAAAVYASVFISGAAGAVSWLMREKRQLRFLPVILYGLLFLFDIKAALYLFFAPLAGYSAYTAYKKSFEPDLTGQQSIFKLFIPLFLFLLLFTVLISRDSAVWSICLYSGIIMLISSVMIMRTARHDREIIASSRFQALNAAVIAAFLIIVSLLGSKEAASPFLNLLLKLYLLLADVLVYVLSLIIKLLTPVFNWLSGLFDFSIELKETTLDLEGMAGEQIFEGLEYTETSTPAWLKILGIALLACAVILILCLIFRFLSGKRGGDRPGDLRVLYAGNNGGRRSGRPAAGFSDADRIRRLYRRYLKLFASKGADLDPSLTSLDIEALIPAGKTEKEREEFRQIYLAARYNRTADKASLRRAAELFNSIKEI